MIENEVEEDSHVSRIDEHKLISYLAVSLSFSRPGSVRTTATSIARVIYI